MAWQWLPIILKPQKAGRDALKVTWSKAKADGFSSDRAA